MRKSNERILCKLSNGEILRLYLIVHVAMETTKTSNFTCQSNSFISIFFTCQVSACELQPFSCHSLANDLYSETAKTVFSHLNTRKPAWNYHKRAIVDFVPAERLANLLNKQAQKCNFEFLLLLLLPGKNATSFKKREVTI